MAQSLVSGSKRAVSYLGAFLQSLKLLPSLWKILIQASIYTKMQLTNALWTSTESLLLPCCVLYKILIFFPFMRYMIVWNSDDFTGIRVRNDMSFPLPFDPTNNFLLPTTKEYAKKTFSSLSQEKGGILGKFGLSSGSKKRKILTSFTI